MHVEQAIFTSARTAQVQGYHLVARSAGVDGKLAALLGRWGPSHASLAKTELDAHSLSFFPTGDNRFVLARTFYGGPEYSGRGGLQVVTRMLVFDREQLDGFENNPVALARVALTLGHLRLTADFSNPLPTVQLPDRSLIESAAGYDDRPAWDPPEAGPSSLLADLQAALQSGQRAAVVSLQQPEEVLERFLQQTPPADRLSVSFTTGLRPSLHRPFRLHFLPDADDAIHRQLASQGVVCISARSRSSSRSGSTKNPAW